ncbi:thioredoxin family protein [Pseudoclavibacter sp. CFCC 14310]|uniref:thioredoxin family protein n=1 Tax=Pseudoclavibacter sp. CFCC 14310 TaxID=2615180 RepID=UPI0013018B23|nr:thioredoxin family protein [Pseudoclavibacter sp. CFCC 14310]KAB1645642.1 thioredoxin family protein [Pseudoclavibacter sp. CFCC 14310]
MSPLTAVFVLSGLCLIATALGLLWRLRQGRLVRNRSQQTPPWHPATTTADPVLGRLGLRATIVQMSTDVCAHCPSVRRSLTAISAADPDIAFVEIDVGSDLDTARRYGIRRTPTVLFFDAHGSQAGRVEGPATQSRYRELIDDLLATGAEHTAGIEGSRGGSYGR